MNIQQSVKVCLKKWVTYNGRASRSEMWWFYMFFIIYAIIAISSFSLISGDNFVIISGYNFVIIYWFGFLVCNIVGSLSCIAVGIRRLHDLDRSGHWIWLYFLPIIGIVILVVLFCMKSTEGANRFGSLDSQ